MKHLGLIDGDELLYKTGFASQHTNWVVSKADGTHLFTAKSKSAAIESIGTTDEDLQLSTEIEVASEKTAQILLHRFLKYMRSIVQWNDYRIYITGEGNFREKIATLLPYKGNRDNAVKPVHYPMLREYLFDMFKAQLIEGMEADDAMSITQWHHYRDHSSNWTTTICSQDKDLNMVPGAHYNPRGSRVERINDLDARFFFYCQLLAGDKSVDYIPGIPGVGLKSAAKILKNLYDSPNAYIYEHVVNTYAAAMEDPKIGPKFDGEDTGAEDRVVEVAQLIWMLDNPNMEMWEPYKDYYGLG